jgi:hypothetical protein
MVSPMRSRLRLTCPCQSRHRIRSIVSARLVPAWRSSAQASGQLLAEVLGFDAAKAAEYVASPTLGGAVSGGVAERAAGLILGSGPAAAPPWGLINQA